MKALHRGSKIALVASARKVTTEEIQFAVEWITEKGFTPVYDGRLFQSDHIFAGDDESRASVIQYYLDRDDIDALWVARGGYGSIRIIDRLDFSSFMHHPKYIIGFSDITVFHGQIQRLGFESIHASMPYNLINKTPEALQSLYDALTGQRLQYRIKASPLNRLGDVKGKIVGGNLSVLYGMLGSASFPETKGKILFIEEVDEYIYHIDRMMIALKRAGMLKQLKGLVVGGLTKINDNPDPFGKTAEEVILEAVSDYDYPVCFGFPTGHFDDNRAIIINRTAHLSVSNDCVIFDE